MSASTLEVRVSRRTVEAEGICSFELVAADGGALPPFTAGAHVEVTLPGVGVRHYSLCSPPSETHHYLIAVLRDAASRGGSVAMHEQVREGDALTISAPKNQFPLAAGAADHLLLAGGIGVTPLLAMAEQLHAAGAGFRLHYATRSKARTAFLQRLAAAPFASRVMHHFDDGDAGQPLDIAAALGAPAPGRHLYVCGPRGFIDAVLATARAQGWPEANLHREFFSGTEVAPVDGDQPFEVRLAKSGRVVMVPADRSVVRALADAGVSVMTSCEQGVCGTCLTRVIDGTPDHRDLYLTPEEQAACDQFLPCCSRAKSASLVLDL